MQVPEALRWTIYQRIQQDERKCPGSEIHPKSHGPQAQVRAQLLQEEEGSVGSAGCREQAPAPRKGGWHGHWFGKLKTRARCLGLGLLLRGHSGASVQQWRCPTSTNLLSVAISKHKTLSVAYASIKLNP